MSDITSIEQEALAAIKGAASLDALDAVRVAELGKKGRVSGLMGTLGAMAPEERKEKGPALNALKGRIEDAVRARRLRATVRGLARQAAMDPGDGIDL